MTQATSDASTNHLMLSRRGFLKHGAFSAFASAMKPILNNSPSELPSASGRPLRFYADRIIRPSGRPFKIGIYLEGQDWADLTGVPAQEAAIQFNHLVNHNISMAASYKGPRQWDFSGADWIVRKAQVAGQTMIGMHLLWGSLDLNAVPAWIINGGYSSNQLIELVQDHITAVMSRYRSIIGAYTVVNEMLDELGRNDWWYQQLGPEYVELAFRQARQVDPSAVLIYNHYDNHTSFYQNWSSTHYVITKADIRHLKSLDLVDAVGLQLHLWTDRPAKNEVVAAMRSFGVPVWITEFDSVQKSLVANPGEEQAQITKEMIEAAFECDVCDSYTSWGFNDRNSFWGERAKACLWDADNRAKPNYYSIQSTLMASAPALRDTYFPLMVR